MKFYTSYGGFLDEYQRVKSKKSAFFEVFVEVFSTKSAKKLQNCIFRLIFAAQNVASYVCKEIEVKCR